MSDIPEGWSFQEGCPECGRVLGTNGDRTMFVCDNCGWQAPLCQPCGGMGSTVWPTTSGSSMRPGGMTITGETCETCEACEGTGVRTNV